jgi:hypothetical protein
MTVWFRILAVVSVIGLASSFAQAEKLAANNAPGRVVTLSTAEIAAVKAGVAAKVKSSVTFDLGMVGHSDATGVVTVCGYVKSPRLPGKPEEKPFMGSFDKGGAFRVVEIGATETQAQSVKSACRDKGIELLA